jgi:hypothetical protein
MTLEGVDANSLLPAEMGELPASEEIIAGLTGVC